MELALKNFGVLVLLSLTLFVVPRAQSEVKKRTAILRFGSQFPWAEQTIADQVNTLLVQDGRVEVVDRDQLARIINEQSLQNNRPVDPNNPQPGQFSPASAVQLGKMLGVPAIVFVRVDAYYGGPHPQVNNGKKHSVSGNMVLKATAQIINVQTGAIFAAPTAGFEQERVLSEWTDGHGPIVIGPVRVPQGQGTKGADSTVAIQKLREEAFNSVEHELAGKVASALVAGPTPPDQVRKIPKVAGVRNGMTFVNAGVKDGVNVGDFFQIIRMVETGLVDPDSRQPLLQKKQVCLLTLSEVEESFASGKCVGDLALSGDQAIAQNH